MLSLVPLGSDRILEQVASVMQPLIALHLTQPVAREGCQLGRWDQFRGYA